MKNIFGGENMKVKKVFAAVCTATLAAVALTACGKKDNSASGDQALTWMKKTELQTMDISKATDETSFNQLNNVYEGLYRLGKNSKVENALATKTEESKDGKRWTFTLRKGAKWSNGDPVTAKDFVYSWQRTVDPKTGSQYTSLFSGIENADEITKGKKSPSSLGIKAVDNYKLEVNLEHRIPYFKLLMGFPLFFPQNQKTVEKSGSSYGTASKYQVYNGPFVQKGWTGSNLKWKLVKNDSYWDKKDVKLKRIDYSIQKTPTTAYNLYQSGKLDAAVLDAQGTKQLKNQTGYTIRKKASTQYLSYNMAKRPEFKNAKLRQAISMAIDRKALANALGGANQAAKTFTAPGIVDVNGKDYVDYVETPKAEAYMKHNPKKARELYKEALKELGKSNLTFNLLGYDDDTSKKATETLQSQLEDSLKDVNVHVQNIPKKTAIDRMVSGNFDASFSGWSGYFADPITFLDLETPDNAMNFGKWNNEKYNDLLADSKTTGDVNKRNKDLENAEKILLEEQGVSPLFHQQEAWMVKPSVKGVIYNGAGASYNFKHAYVAK